MKHFKIIFSDIDGTLLDADRKVSAFTAEQIRKLNKDTPFILVSARMPRQMANFQKQLSTEANGIIAYNGALVITGTEVIHSTEINTELLKKIVSLNKPEEGRGFHISLYHHDEWFAEDMDTWALREKHNTGVQPEIRKTGDTLAHWKENGKGAHKVMCMGEAHIIEQVYNELEKNHRDELHLYRSKDTYIEIANRSVSKLTGIHKLLEKQYSDVTLDQVMAFGDNYNDVEMIKAVGHGVAVANAREEVKAVANALTLHHKEDGVGKYLQQYFML